MNHEQPQQKELSRNRCRAGVDYRPSDIAAYIYCIATYGFLFGLGLGWLPSGILAAIVGGLTVFLWGAAIFAACGVVVLILFSMRR